MKSIPIKESSIQKSILSWGNANRILMHRINVIGTPYIRHGKTYYRPAQNTGMADILCIHLIENIPVNVWLEVKTKTGKLCLVMDFADGNFLLFKINDVLLEGDMF